MIVVDASVALSWLLPDTEANQTYGASIAALAASVEEELVAPRVFAAECSYRLLKFGHDAIYLALAASLGCKLATLDGGLRSASQRAGVTLA